MDLEEFINSATQYVKLETDSNVLSAKHVESFSLLGKEDHVLRVKTDDQINSEWWVVGGDSLMNLYEKSQFRTANEVFSFHVGLMMRFLAKDHEVTGPPPAGTDYDVFISHASEDKESFVRPLANWLNNLGLYVWYDEFELEIGDSLRQSIDKGLTNSRYGIVVLSKHFFEKNWPQYELNGLTSREIDGQKVILPIWHGVTKKDVLKYSPSLADKVAADSSKMDIKALSRVISKVIDK